MLSIVFFAYMTFVTSLETSFKKVVSAFKNPWPSMLAVLLTHIGSPLIAWFMGYIFYINDPMIRFGLLIVAAVPMGVTSIIWTGIAGGDVAVSIMAVTLDTIIAPVLLPGFFMAVAGKFIHIDYFQMVIQLLWMVTIPSIVGMRHNAFGMVLALSYFTPAMAISITLSVLFQQPISALIAQVLSCKKTEEF